MEERFEELMQLNVKIIDFGLSVKQKYRNQPSQVRNQSIEEKRDDVSASKTDTSYKFWESYEVDSWAG